MLMMGRMQVIERWGKDWPVLSPPLLGGEWLGGDGGRACARDGNGHGTRTVLQRRLGQKSDQRKLLWALTPPKPGSGVKSLVLQFLFIVSEKADKTYEKNCKSMSNKLTKNGG